MAKHVLLEFNFQAQAQGAQLCMENKNKNLKNNPTKNKSFLQELRWGENYTTKAKTLVS